MFKPTNPPWCFSDNRKFGWKTHPFSVTRGNYGVALANIPNLKSIPDDEKESNARLMAAAPELWICVISMLRWYSNRLDGHNISPIENQPPEIQRAMRIYKEITGENYA